MTPSQDESKRRDEVLQAAPAVRFLEGDPQPPLLPAAEQLCMGLGQERPRHRLVQAA